MHSWNKFGEVFIEIQFFFLHLFFSFLNVCMIPNRAFKGCLQDLNCLCSFHCLLSFNRTWCLRYFKLPPCWKSLSHKSSSLETSACWWEAKQIWLDVVGTKSKFVVWIDMTSYFSWIRDSFFFDYFPYASGGCSVWMDVSSDIGLSLLFLYSFFLYTFHEINTI